MLDLYSILWVTPGVIFIYLYNRKRPAAYETAINLSGWPYVFALNIIAALTWIPAELTSKTIFKFLKTFNCIETLFIWFSTMVDIEATKIQLVQTLIISIGFTIILLLLVQWGPISRMIFPPVYDNFCRKCAEWENRAIILTLKTGKAYIGILWKYPESPKSRYVSQTISIIPLRSGYREKEKKRIEWTTDYPYKESYFNDMELILPRSEILTFGKFNIEAHKYFEELKNI